MTVIGHLMSPLDLLDPATVAHLDDDVGALDPVAVLDLDRLEELTPDELTRMRAGHFSFRRIPIGVRTRPLSPTDIGPGQLLLDRMATTLVPDDGWFPTHVGFGDRHAQGVTTVRVPDPLTAAETIRRNVAQNPTAALTLDTLLRITATSSARESLIAESFAHAMLLAGADYRRWRQGLPDAAAERASTPPARVQRRGDTVEIRLSSDAGRTGLDFAARTRLAQLFHELDPQVATIRICADGPDFWGTSRPDDALTPEAIASTHLQRMAGSLGAAVYPHRHRLTVHVTGRCVGVGVELAALAHRVTASPDAVFELPQLRMGLITGCGGTVALTRRLGRWRAAYLALWAGPIDAATAYQWHLVDDIVDGPAPG